MNGRDGTTTFLPLNTKIGGQVNNKPSIGQFFTRDQPNTYAKRQNQVK